MTLPRALDVRFELSAPWSPVLAAVAEREENGREMLTRRRLLSAGAVAPWMLASGRAAAVGELVDLLIDTPRAALTEALVRRIRDGLTPSELLRGLSIAACREVSPYPDVGFKYHAVMMLQSVYLSIGGLSKDRAWLPLMWGADYFKAASATEDRFRNWSLPDMSLHSGEPTSSAALVSALEAWDAEAAHRTTAALVYQGKTDEALQVLLLHAARDFRSIGHKTIAAANAHRLHAVFGRSVAAPLVQSLALAVQNSEGDEEPARHDYAADADWKHVDTWARGLPPDWEAGGEDAAAAHDMLDELRSGTSQQAVAAATDLLMHGVNAHTVWETVMLFAAELILRRSDIIAVHANTTANAMYYGYLVSEADRSKRVLLLQAVAFMARFRALHEARRVVRERRIDGIEPTPATSIDEIFATLGDDRYSAVRQALGWLQVGGEPALLAARERWHATLKNTGTHDIKFTEAMLENCERVRSPRTRNALLSASLMYANATSAADDDVVVRARELLAG